MSSNIYDLSSYGVSKNQTIDNLVLITGASGYIGMHLVALCVEANYKVRVYDNFTFGNYESFIKLFPQVEIIKGCISDPVQLSKALDSVSIVIALAAIVGDPACGINKFYTYNYNYNSTRLLVDLANYSGVKRLVFASSCSVYGESTGNNYLTETSQLNPVSSYAYSRVISEEYIKSYSKCDYVILRLSTIYGISMRMRYDLVVNLVTAKSFFDKAATIFGGDQWRPFLHCFDAARAFFITATTDKNVSGEVFNVGVNSENYQLKSLKFIIESYLPDAKIKIDSNATDMRNYKVDFSKISSCFDFKVKFTLPDGISQMLSYFNDNIDEKYDNEIFNNYKYFLKKFNKD